jgi:hypothetical protein
MHSQIIADGGVIHNMGYANSITTGPNASYTDMNYQNFQSNNPMVGGFVPNIGQANNQIPIQQANNITSYQYIVAPT